MDISPASKPPTALFRTLLGWTVLLAALYVVSTTEDMLGDAIEKSRRLSHELSPAVLRQKDLAQIMRWLAEQVRARYGLILHVRADGSVVSESEIAKIFLYRSALELLYNVVKHARVQEVWLRLRRANGYICLHVVDRGQGFDVQDLRATTGFGLLSIRKRVELLGGRMRIRSAKGQGSAFFIALPEAKPAVAAAGGPAAAAATRPDGGV